MFTALFPPRPRAASKAAGRILRGSAGRKLVGLASVGPTEDAKSLERPCGQTSSEPGSAVVPYGDPSAGPQECLACLRVGEGHQETLYKQHALQAPVAQERKSSGEPSRSAVRGKTPFGLAEFLERWKEMKLRRKTVPHITLQ